MPKLLYFLKVAIFRTTLTEYEKINDKYDWQYHWFNISNEIKEIFFYSWYTPLVTFMQNIQRTLKWFPIIWKDRHWDH